ncbi:MAG: thiamine-phosphate pyrophosphorylase [Actinomycetota bacterium]|nr:thiamine-phosphate pyrophosphorylase [Actinomycetota bacterium]
MGPLLLFTDRLQARSPLVAVVAAAVRAGVRSVVLRERDLPWPSRLALARILNAVLEPAGGRLLVAGPTPETSERMFDGCHLALRDPWPGAVTGLFGCSCHTTAELAAAARAGARYATLSPIFASTSKPGYGPALGPEGLSCPRPLPVYALGGVEDPGRVRACWEAGAAGVAVMGAVMRADDPQAVTSALLRAVAA